MNKRERAIKLSAEQLETAKRYARERGFTENQINVICLLAERVADHRIALYAKFKED